MQDDRLLVILNFSKDAPVFMLPPNFPLADKALLISNYAVEPAEDIHRLTLRPFEARVYRIK